MNCTYRVWISVALLLLGFAPPLHAQDTPSSSRPITIVVPFAPGGGVDILARLIAERLQDRRRQTVVVENRAGAGGVVGVDAVARAAPDGNTLLLMDISSVLLRWLHKEVPFDVVRDFAPIALIATTPLLLLAHPSLQVNDAKELIAYAKANPGKLSAGTPGVGTPHHLAAAMFNAAAQVDITHVPYRGTAPALNDLVAGQIPLIWATPIAVMPFVAAGKVKALGSASPHRAALLPDVPTIAENALPGFNVDLWFGIAAPAGTPPDLVARLSKDIGEITENPDMRQRMSALGYDLDYRAGERFRELIVSDHEKYGAVIRAAAIAPN